MRELVRLLEVSKSYPGGVRALDGVSLLLGEGTCTALLGPNGAGKTTLMKILCGLLKPDSGTVCVEGRFGYFLSEVGLWPHLTGFETLQFVGALYGITEDVLKTRIAELSGLLGLGHQLRKRYAELSEGWKRRLGLAAALIHNPDILFLDEPSSGLDVEARLSFWEMLRRLLKERRVALFLATHDLEEAERLGEQVGILEKGRLLALEPPEKLKALHGAGDEVELKLAAGSPVMPDLFKNIPGVSGCHQEDSRVTVYIQGGLDRLPDLFRLVERSGARVEGLRVKPCTLESVFLNLTGHPMK